MPTRRTCLILPIDGSRILLGDKLRGFGQGKLVGIGGKLEPAESLRDAAVRELQEESGLRADPRDLDHAAYLDFRFPHRPEWHMDSHVFVVRRWAGQVRACDEIEPAWYSVDALPYDRMWDESRLWLPHVLRGERVEAQVTYGVSNDLVAALTMRVVEKVTAGM